MITTVSIMRCCGKAEAFLFGLALFFAVLAVPAAQASGIDAENARLVANDGVYYLNADFRVRLNPQLENAVNRGVVLYFTADFELTRLRWYWFDQTVARHGRTFQLSYHALTREYRLSSGALHQSFSSLEDALRVLSRLRHWQVAEKDGIDTDTDYMARVRLRLDLSQMAKTFQVSALSNRDWNLSSGWLAWNFSSPADEWEGSEESDEPAALSETEGVQ